MSWNAATPVGTDSIRDGDDVIRELKQDLAAALATEGIFPGAVVASPVFRWKPRRGTTAARPAVDSVSPGSIYINSQTYRIERDNGTTWDEITSLTPPGVMTMFGGATAPSGWLMCDGATYLATDYAGLFAAIGTAFGTTDAGLHFNVPDMRGRFARGADNAAGRDPDAAARTAMAVGGNTGDSVGSIQAEAFKAHTHPISSYVWPPEIAAGNRGFLGGESPAFNTESAGANETRPINAALNFIIKV